jgi:hypothetical protein
MQTYVKDRQNAASPANGRSQGKPDRQANAANARIVMVNGHPVQQPHASSGIPARGFGNAQNSSAVLQQPLQHRQSGPGLDQKRDPYDTDAESLDTTVNPSLVQVEDSQQKEQHYQQQGHAVNLGRNSETGEEDEYESDELEDQFEDDDHELAHDDQEIIRANGLGHLSHDEQLSFLQQAAPGRLPTIQGDSYPPTTNGEFSEWGGGQEAPSNFHDEGAPVSSSPQRQNINNQAARMTVPHPLLQQQRRNVPISSQNMQKSSTLFQNGAQIREQSRAAAPPLQHGGQDIQQHGPTLPANQHPTNRRNKPDATANLPNYTNSYPSTYVQPSRSQQNLIRQPSGPRTQLQPKNNVSIEPHASFKRQPLAPAIREPVMQQPVEQLPVEELEAVPYEDYDEKTLSKMSYEELKNESFDTDPHARPSVLTEDELRKPLVERLRLVQMTLDAGQQSEFFRSLPTTEWEDAGDWFLDQFQDIIKRTKQARQKKRKLAQDLEAEVEKRYEHVSKRQHQVQQAMDKMKAQGEGLVPRSPRPSKSPRLKRG